MKHGGFGRRILVDNQMNRLDVALGRLRNRRMHGHGNDGGVIGPLRRFHRDDAIVFGNDLVAEQGVTDIRPGVVGCIGLGEPGSPKQGRQGSRQEESATRNHWQYLLQN